MWPRPDAHAASADAPTAAFNEFSSHLFPCPSDWGERVYTTGPWLFRGTDTAVVADGKETTLEQMYKCPDALVGFMAKASLPLYYIGFGSMPCMPQAASQVVSKVLRAAWQHNAAANVVLLSGAAHLSTDALPLDSTEDRQLAEWAREHVCCITHVEHFWLLPHCSIAMHHGGAGTTHCCALHGVPQVIVPVACDQFMMGHAVADQGIGTRTVHRLNDSKLSVHELHEALQRIDKAGVRKRAADVAGCMAAQDGRDIAIAHLEQLVAEHAAKHTPDNK